MGYSIRTALSLLILALLLAAAAVTAGPGADDDSLIAHWAFDEVLGARCQDLSGNGLHATPQTGAGHIQRVRGVHGNAIALSGAHLLAVPGEPAIGTADALSLLAWVRPTDLSGYREIFRKEDGENRLLFSFQHDGTVLSLGLNIGGYIECDAPLDPARVLDGQWHHCAATFDGRTMRVYLDGEEIGALDRPGRAVGSGTAPGCIGSSNGGESFQGALDDLRVYARALTAQEVEQAFRAGSDAASEVAEGFVADEPELDLPLLAHWKLNDPPGATMLTNATDARALDLTAEPPIGRVRGVHGAAIDLHGIHSIRTAGGLGLEACEAITLSAWVRPTDLSGFREILRQESADRVLLSFQESGTVLSFGLNVNGYGECDAPIDPTQVADGQWHHCAATFDGATMRVYLDGREIGSLTKPGRVSLQPDHPYFLGSTNGESEHFQGALDDVRIYADALSPDQTQWLCDQGAESARAFATGLEADLGRVYARGDSFAKTLADTRARITRSGDLLTLDTAQALERRLTTDFRDEAARFTQWTGLSPLEFVASSDPEAHVAAAERLVDLLLEYKPVTEAQWAKQSAEDLARWKEADALAARFAALRDASPEAIFSAEWVDLIMEVGSRIVWRPYVSEPVAPYVKPSTPEARDLSPEEARELLERDWLHQAGYSPTRERILQEIGWARDLARRLRSESNGSLRFGEPLRVLSDLERRAQALEGPDEGLYLAVREVKREIMFSNPVIDFERVLLVDMPYPQGSEWPHETRHRLGYMAVPGARLLILDGLSPDGKLTQLMPRGPLHGSFWRPDVSFDGRQVLFCFKPHNEKSFHVYEINVDGSGLRQITDGIYDDLDPIYLPDGEHILFSTTRAHTYVRCMPPTNAYILARCDLSGANMYFISANNEPDYLPSVLDDGRVIYTRWEYTDKPLWRAQGLWTVHPDGAQVNTFWGNQSVWPDLLKDARGIPGSKRVMFTGSAHHGWFSGSVGIIDPDGGFNFPNGITKVTADMPWPESGNGPVDPIECEDYHASGAYDGYYSPYPLSERDFLVSASRGGKFVLYLMDVYGNRELVYEGVHNALHAMPLRPRPRPAVLPDAVRWPTMAERESPEAGVVFSDNVYEGVPELQGRAKFLRVLNIDPKTYTYWHKRPYISTGPEVSMVQSDGVKRVLGTVPIEADGSVSFYAPSGKALHFQLLDENYRALQTMRSFVNVMPGEKRGCLGCHELHSRAPSYGGKSIALSKEPRTIEPPPWDDDTVSFARYVQPTLDRYCGDCHQGDGEAREVLDLTRRPGFMIFDEPYVTLTGNPTWSVPYERPADPSPGFGIANTLMVEGYATVDPVAYVTPEPMKHLSYASRLVDIASSGEHHGVQVDPISLQRLIVWIDTMCPYRGEEEIRAIPDPEFQGVDWLAIRPRIATAPVIPRPGPVK